MNSLSKRIRKFKKTPKIAKYEESDDPQQFTACIANLNMIVAEDQFKQIVTKDLLLRLMEYLKHNNTQVVINSLNALQNVLLISDNFGRGTRDLLKDLGLIGILVLFPVQEATLSSFLTLAIEIFETWDVELLTPLYQKVLPLLHNCLVQVYSEEIILEALNLLQVLTEIQQYDLKNVDFNKVFQHEIIKSLHFANQMKLKSYTLQIYLNLGKLDQEMLQLINEIIRINIFQELDNIESFLQKQVTMEEESEFKQDERLLSTVQIWRCSAQSIIQVLVYLNRIYEEESQINQVFTQRNLVGELQELVLKNYNNFAVIISKKLFTDQTTFTDELLSLTLMILNLGNNLLTGLQSLLTIQSLEPILPQVWAAVTTEVLADEDKKELFQSYLVLLVKIIKCNPNLVLQVPEQFPIQLCDATENTEILFHIVELMKIRYSSKLKNDISTIRLVTQKLLKLMSQSQIMLAAQALDCLFDVYTEEDYNLVLVEMNIIDLLKQGYSYLQSQLPVEKKILPKDDWKFLKLTVVNLQQFIEYKINILK